jgi:hypothetical protein
MAYLATLLLAVSKSWDRTDSCTYISFLELVFHCHNRLHSQWIAATFSDLALATHQGEKCNVKGEDGFCLRKKPCDVHSGKSAATDKCPKRGEVCCLGLDTSDAKDLLSTISSDTTDTAV